jgi:hypothetical protein
MSHSRKQYRAPCQIFYIRQKHSYSRLYISRELFDHIIGVYSAFSHIRDFVLPFSFKTRDGDIGHAPFDFGGLETLFVLVVN